MKSLTSEMNEQHGNALKTYLPFQIDYFPEGWKSSALPTGVAVARIKVQFLRLVSLRTTFALGSELDHCQGQNGHTHTHTPARGSYGQFSEKHPYVKKKSLSVLN